MDGYTELANLFRVRDNKPSYSPLFGKITSLPELKIQCGNNITLDKSEITAMFNIAETIQNDDRVEYVNLDKTVVLLPYAQNQKFIAIGVLME